MQERNSIILKNGNKLAFVTAGDETRPALLLLHGFPSSANTFRDILPVLAEEAYVIAPDLPGFGDSDVLEETSFDNLAQSVTELLKRLGVRERFIYLHDFGAPVGLRLAMDQPELVKGLIIQNANAHRTGFGPQWQATQEFWKNPTEKTEATATAHLTFEGVRDQYVSGVPDDIARKISPSVWEEDWRVMSLPGRLAANRALVADYGNYVKKFAQISEYLRSFQPPALMVWGRHDVFFDLAETVSWMEDLPRMEAHILDGGHFLLETHAAPASALMKAFIKKVNELPG
ncbi:MAG TPA: alpha/beta hydrolase [Verrucomicrobiae bacterium]|nr:alpha/beta hydrolase [Verrucomicrobiae bacterium]